MPQLSLYLDEETMDSLRKSAAARGVPFHDAPATPFAAMLPHGLPGSGIYTAL